MVRKAWLFGLALILTLGVQASSARPMKAQLSKLATMQVDLSHERALVGDEPINFNASNLLRRDEADDSIYVPAYGDTMVVGWTYYDYQSNGTLGKMIAKDSQGTVHFNFMKGYNTNDSAGLRHVIYNYLANGELGYDPAEGSIVDNSNANPPRAGYSSMTLLPADERAIIFYHVVSPPGHAAGYTGPAMGVDFLYCFGAFSNYYPNEGDLQLIWPRGAVSRNSFAHIMGTENALPAGTPQRIAYWRGDTDRDFTPWTFNNEAAIIDTGSVISATAAASVLSNKVVLAWHHCLHTGTYSTKNNDLRYIVSEDGQNFDFAHDIHSLTKIMTKRPTVARFDTLEAYGDTLRPYDDIDIEFDPWDDNLFAVFGAGGFWEDVSVDTFATGTQTGRDYDKNILWFWNSERDTMTQIYDGWYINRFIQQGANGYSSRHGGWRANADRGSIAFDVDHPGKIYVVWVLFKQMMDWNADRTNWVYFDGSNGTPRVAQDTSQAGYEAADVMVSISTDYGITWREPINITDTKWQGNQAPAPGQMASEAWSTAAYVADSCLYIAYVQDTDAGGLPQGEGQPTNSPYMYNRIAVNDLPLNAPVALHQTSDGTPFQFHNYLDWRPRITGVARDIGAPTATDVVNVMADVVGGGPQHVAGAWIQYMLNGQGETNEVAMEAIRGDTTFSGDIPRQANGTTVWYRIRAVNDTGNVAYAPTGYWHGYVVRGENEMRIRDIQYRPEAWASYTDGSMYEGYDVKVSGTVTTDAEFARIYGGYAMQDERAAWCGIIVRNVDITLHIGDRISVTGTVMERDPNDPTKWEYETYIEALDGGVEIVSQDNPEPEPLFLPKTKLLTFGGGCESLEGLYVRVWHVLIDALPGLADTLSYWPIKDTTTAGWFSTIGMTEQAILTAGIREYTEGYELYTVKGIFTENNGYYSINLRNREDLAVDTDVTPTPYSFALSPAYPNPFNPTTTLNFSLPHKMYAKLGVYDLQGRLVAMAAQGQFEAGNHAITVDASELSTGVYILRLDTPGRSASQKLILMK
jgi:hypothetical protein